MPYTQAVDFCDLKDTFEKLKKNEDFLGEAINAPKYARAFSALKRKALNMMLAYYEQNLCLMEAESSKEAQSIHNLRLKIAKQDAKRLKEAYVKRDADEVFQITQKAHEKDLKNWFKICYPKRGQSNATNQSRKTGINARYLTAPHD